MESISVFDIFKIGVGPSSSHTMGPWRAAKVFFLEALKEQGVLDQVTRVRCDLYGSLAKTGIGHGTDLAVLCGLCGLEVDTCDVNALQPLVKQIKATRRLPLNGGTEIEFDPATDLNFHRTESLPFHPNGMTLTAWWPGGERAETYYSVGGGFVVQEGWENAPARQVVQLPHPIETGAEIQAYCDELGLPIHEVVWLNERAWREDSATREGLRRLKQTFIACVHRGCCEQGTLPGGLGVARRAKGIHDRLLGQAAPGTPEAWLATIRTHKPHFESMLKWVSVFALAVNEENAAFGRVVTAPTNGAAGVIPAVMMYGIAFRVFDRFEPHPAGAVTDPIEAFLLTASEIGCLFKKGATISAAMGGCQAEVGVSSAMAAAGLCAVMGGSPAQAMMAAEIAMEHHLGMTCDPIGGLVQVPCIERNTMGAIKAVTAAQLALESDPAQARVSLDAVVRTMWETAQDMNSKYKETSDGGLATQIPVLVPEC